MTDIKGTNIASAITPFTTDDSYPTHYAKYGCGGWREVDTIAERDAIPEKRRSVGMVVAVQEDGKNYQLQADSTWKEFGAGSSGGATSEQAITTLATSGTINLVDNTFNRVTVEGAVVFVLPTVEDNTIFHEIFIQLSMSTVQTIDLGTTWFFNKKQPDLSSAGYYNLVYEYDGTHWVVSAVNKGEVA